jgi:tellurite resistance protein TehA-like permease
MISDSYLYLYHNQEQGCHCGLPKKVNRYGDRFFTPKCFLFPFVSCPLNMIHCHLAGMESMDENVRASPDAERSPTTRRRLGQPTWRAALQGFSTQWFLIPQGTGIIAVILHRLDYQFRGLEIISYLFWITTIVLLLVLVALYALRCLLFPKHVADSLRNKPGEMDGLASISISFTSILQMAAMVLVPSWHGRWGTVIYGLWWANVAMAVLANVAIPFATTQLHPPGVAGLSPAARLPLIAMLTAAAGAGTICTSAGLGSDLQAPAVVVGYLLLGMGFGFATILDALFLARLFDRGTERGAVVVAPPNAFQVMILCGPWGQGSFALQGLGQALLHGAFTSVGGPVFLTPQAADAMGYASILAGLLSWGLGTFWWAYATFSLLAGLRNHWPPHKVEFSLVAWSIVFPWVSISVSLALFPHRYAAFLTCVLLGGLYQCRSPVRKNIRFSRICRVVNDACSRARHYVALPLGTDSAARIQALLFEVPRPVTGEGVHN